VSMNVVDVGDGFGDHPPRRRFRDAALSEM
jgi:hypothetical protein